MVDMEMCAEKHKNVEEKLDLHDKRLNNHGDRIDKLENNQVRTEVIVQNLCEQIKSLVGILKVVSISTIGFILTTCVGFIVWYLQNLSV